MTLRLDVEFHEDIHLFVYRPIGSMNGFRQQGR